MFVKKILLMTRASRFSISFILLFFTNTLCFSQLNDSNFNQAIEDCLSTNPVDGMCTNSPYGVMPNWDVINVTDMSYAFELRSHFNADISGWNTGNVTRMNSMFFLATSFNQDIGSWDTTNVNDMNQMFSNAESFNQDIGGWDTSNVNHFLGMFQNAISFNQSLSNWNVSNALTIAWMFNEATSFNQDLSSWTVNNAILCQEFRLDTPNWILPKPNFTNCDPN